MSGIADSWTPSGFTHHFVPAGPGRLHVVRGGNGPPLVLLAGWPQTWIAWRHLMPALAHDFDVLAIELRGQGTSDIVDGSYDTGNGAADIVAALDQLGIDKAFLLGHDVGAWVAFTLLRDHGQRVRSAGLLDAAIPGLVGPEFFSPVNAKKVWQFYFHAQPELAAELVAGREASYLGWYFEHKCFRPGSISPDAVEAYVAAYSRPGAMLAGFRWYADMAETITATTGNASAPITVPVFALGGVAATGPLLGSCLAPFCTRLESAILADCGHYIPEEAPDAVLDWVRRQFLAGGT